MTLPGLGGIKPFFLFFSSLRPSSVACRPVAARSSRSPPRRPHPPPASRHARRHLVDGHATSGRDGARARRAVCGEERGVGVAHPGRAVGRRPGGGGGVRGPLRGRGGERRGEGARDVSGATDRCL